MKKLILIVIAFAAAPALRAGDNPDKYPSIGFSYAETHAHDAMTGNFVSARPIVFDIRVPASDSLTLTFLGGPTTIATTANNSKSGFTLGFGARFYLPFKIVRD